ncbi:MAG: hypothetical protein NQU45_07965 [Methanothermobacter sp.]|nr:hypothetical protein [Methanothermobacter sp.]
MRSVRISSTIDRTILSPSDERGAHINGTDLSTFTALKVSNREDYSYVILEASTWTNKSAIAYTLTGVYQPAYILTMTKQLQD